MPNTEIVSADEFNDAQLRTHADTINQSIDLIVQHEESFRESTLEPCLLIGRELAKAQELFGLSPQERTLPATLSRGVTTSGSKPNPLGFTAWLAREIPRLKRPTALKYATCFKALELPTDAPDSKVRAKLKDLRHEASRDNLPMPSLNNLYRAGKPSTAPRIEPPKEDPEDLAGEGRVQLHAWMMTWDRLMRSGWIEPLGKHDLQPIETFLTTARDQIRARLKSSN